MHMFQPIIGHANQPVRSSKLPNAQPWFVHTTAKPCFFHINPAWHTFRQSSPTLYISKPPDRQLLACGQDHARLPQHTTTRAAHNKHMAYNLPGNDHSSNAITRPSSCCQLRQLVWTCPTKRGSTTYCYLRHLSQPMAMPPSCSWDCEPVMGASCHHMLLPISRMKGLTLVAFVNSYITNLVEDSPISKFTHPFEFWVSLSHIPAKQFCNFQEFSCV